MEIKVLEHIQELAKYSAGAAQLGKPGDAMQYAQAALNLAKATEALVGSGCRFLSGGAKGLAAQPQGDLLKERNDIEKLALEWGDRWLAEHGEHGFDAVRPITFDRAKLAEHLYCHGDGKRENEGLSMNKCRAKVGLGPLP